MEETFFEELLESNGISRDQIGTPAMEQVTHLEMFLQGFPKLVGFSHFPFLRSLSIIKQDIHEIENLEQCPLLESIFIVEGYITKIQGLSNLRNLKQLFLYNNRIGAIEGLENLTNLETLNLSDNYIPTITGISQLLKLRDLSLARNLIVTVPDNLVTNSNIEVLNLSDNKIGSFKEVRPLCNLPKLTDVCFADPMWGECPLAGLCNYQTYVLFMLPNLTQLDTLLLAEEIKVLAEATFMKKQMYYNMRIKTLHRNARNIIRIAYEGKKAKVQYRRPLIHRLVLQQKELERELDERRYYKGGGSDEVPPDQQGLKEKLDKLNGRLSAYSRSAGDDSLNFEACAGDTYRLVDAYVSRMMLELDTAGNIRLEEGKPSDLWYTSCVDLVQSRFNAAEYAGLGANTVNVMSVTRVHNRWLRNRFERQVLQRVDTSDQNYKRSMEYLFLGENPCMPGELDRIVEHGCRNPDDLYTQGLDGAVCLSNTLAIADSLRLHLAADQRALSNAPPPAGGAADSSPLIGRIMIVKVFLGKTAQDSSTPLSNRLGSGGAASGHQPSLLDKDGKLVVAGTLESPQRIQRSAYPSMDAVFRSRRDDQKHRIWYVLNNALVLPEYLVEFQYEPTAGSKLQMWQQANESSAGGAMPSEKTKQSILSGLEPDLRPLSRPLMHWLSFYFDPQLVQQPLGASSNMANAGAGGAKAEEAVITELVESQPQVPERKKLDGGMSQDSLAKLIPGLPSFASLTYLSLHACGLKKIENMEEMKQLQVLVLSFNELSKIKGLNDLMALRHLDLGNNEIKKLDGMPKGNVELRHLVLSCNQVARLEEVYTLKKAAPHVTYLDLSNNPVCDDKSYRPTALRKFKKLLTFDQLEVSDAEKALFGDNAGAVTLQMVLEHGVATNRLAMDSALGSHQGHGIAAEHVLELVLERRSIRRLDNLEKLVNLRRASFLDNQVSHIEGLEACSSLEELCFEDNRIGVMEGLRGLTRLKKLQLGKNRLVALDQMQFVTNLTLLSVEDNQLTTLAGIEPLVQLMELYAGNNKISELREVQRLRNLPKMIILDLSGNPCAQAGGDDYRLYIIFNVRKLKVLDGIPIDMVEQASAKSRYSGRLTLDFLQEKLGHRSFDRIRDLDCSGLKIRDVGNVFLGEEFESLQELTLDNNALLETGGLALLRQLVVLKLNSNRLGEEGCFNFRRMVERNMELSKVLSDPAQLAAGVPQHFPVLQVLQLGGNQISSISSLQLSSLTSLRTLFLQNNEITKIDGLDGLVNLQELVLDHNRIRYVDADSFAGVPRLRELRIEENGLRSLTNLQHCMALQALHVGHNRISELSDLERITGLTSLMEITLANNPIFRKQNYRSVLISKIPKLHSADGLAIGADEREYVENMMAPPPEAMQPAVGKGQVAIRMNTMDFTALQYFGAGQGPAVAGGPGTPGVAAQGSSNHVPSIQSNTVVLPGASGFSLEVVAVGMDAAGRDAWGRPVSHDTRRVGSFMPKGAVNRAATGPATSSPARRPVPTGAGGTRPANYRPGFASGPNNI